MLVTPQEVLAMKALDRIGELLREKGLTLDELIESGRKERSSLIEEMYGIRQIHSPRFVCSNHSLTPS